MYSCRTFRLAEKRWRLFVADWFVDLELMAGLLRKSFAIKCVWSR